MLHVEAGERLIFGAGLEAGEERDATRREVIDPDEGFDSPLSLRLEVNLHLLLKLHLEIFSSSVSQAVSSLISRSLAFSFVRSSRCDASTFPLRTHGPSPSQLQFLNTAWMLYY